MTPKQPNSHSTEVTLRIDNERTTIHASVVGDDAYRRAKDALDEHLDDVNHDDVVHVDVEIEAITGDAADSDDDAADADREWEPRSGSAHHRVLAALDAYSGEPTGKELAAVLDDTPDGTASSALSQLKEREYAYAIKDDYPWSYDVTPKGKKWLEDHEQPTGLEALGFTDPDE